MSGAVFAVVAAARALAPALSRPGVAVAAAMVVALTLALLAGGCGQSGPGSGRIEVVATTTQIGDWTREVGGTAVSVDQVLQPNTDPDEYEPRPSDIVAAADVVVFANGDDLDQSIAEIVDDSGSGAEVVDLGAVAEDRLPGESSGAEASKYDPHWWHDPRNAEAAVREIERRPAAADPVHRREFERNARAYLTRLRGLDRSIARCCFAADPGREAQAGHRPRRLRILRPSLRDRGHRRGHPLADDRGSALRRDLSELAKTIEANGVTAIFPESRLSPKVAEAIAARQEPRSATTPLRDTLGSPGATYLGMGRRQTSPLDRRVPAPSP